MSFLDKTGLTRLWANISTLVDTKVDKVEGKGLSTNDFTDEYKNKVDNIGTGGGSGADINSGPVLPETANEGDIFLKTSLVGTQYTETLTSVYAGGTNSSTTVSLTYPAESIVSVSITSNDPSAVVGLSWTVVNGKLKLSAVDWYSPVDLSVTYVIGEESQDQYPKQVYCTIKSYDYDISNALVKGVDNGSMITLYLDYSLAYNYDEESFSFDQDYANKTVLGIYALTESGITPYDTSGESGPPQLGNFTPGQSLSQGFYFYQSPTRLSGDKAVIVIYYV